MFLSLLSAIFITPTLAATNYIPKQFSNVNTGDGLYPYSLNNRRQQQIMTTNKSVFVPKVGDGTSPMQSTGKRTVVKRPGLARAASSNKSMNTSSRRLVPRSNIARSATNNSVFQNMNRNQGNTNRIVVARSASSSGNVRNTSKARRSTTNVSTSTATSSQKCFANYKECMETYCKREDAAYNRCFCSAKLAQIDSKYQKKIDSLIQEIIRLKNTTITDDSEEPLDSVEDYWNSVAKEYTGTNPWIAIDDNINTALDKLNFADTETRVRGQNAFNMGHKYCVSYLRSCSYMASNLRDAYKSEITRDCAAYEETLQKIQNVAESVIENYSE